MKTKQIQSGTAENTSFCLKLFLLQFFYFTEKTKPAFDCFSSSCM